MYKKKIRAFIYRHFGIGDFHTSAFGGVAQARMDVLEYCLRGDSLKHLERKQEFLDALKLISEDEAERIVYLMRNASPSC